MKHASSKAICIILALQILLIILTCSRQKRSWFHKEPTVAFKIPYSYKSLSYPYPPYLPILNCYKLLKGYWKDQFHGLLFQLLSPQQNKEKLMSLNFPLILQTAVASKWGIFCENNTKKYASVFNCTLYIYKTKKKNHICKILCKMQNMKEITKP